MALLGTRVVWKPFVPANGTVHESQILKNSGYISIVLHSATYDSKGNRWQKMFGGKDQVALTSTVRYATTGEPIEARAVQDSRTVQANRTHRFGISRLVATKVPTTADGIEMQVALTVVANDRLAGSLEMLNDEAFQLPLEISPIPIGQIASIAKLVKRVVDAGDDDKELHATYAGVIGAEPVADPLQQKRLVAGHLVMVDTADPESAALDPARLEVTKDELRYEGRPIDKTAIVYTITFDRVRGVDEGASWARRYQDAIAAADELYDPDADPEAVWGKAVRLWTEASALLFDDIRYVTREKRDIKTLYMAKLRDAYTAAQAAARPPSPDPSGGPDGGPGLFRIKRGGPVLPSTADVEPSPGADATGLDAALVADLRDLALADDRPEDEFGGPETDLLTALDERASAYQADLDASGLALPF